MIISHVAGVVLLMSAACELAALVLGAFTWRTSLGKAAIATAGVLLLSIAVFVVVKA